MKDMKDLFIVGRGVPDGHHVGDLALGPDLDLLNGNGLRLDHHDDRII